jgi:hypothetical protein
MTMLNARCEICQFRGDLIPHFHPDREAIECWCRRYPKAERKQITDWCGEFTPDEQLQIPREGLDDPPKAGRVDHETVKEGPVSGTPPSSSTKRKGKTEG